MDAGPSRARPEVVAGIVNALIVWLLPIGFMALGPLLFNSYSNNSTTVVGVDPTGAGRARMLMFWLQVGGVLIPFAALAGFRTHHHASQRPPTSWRGVLEAGACGAAVALVVLLPGILTRPLEAGPYITVYGGAAMILGLIVGFFLRLTALLVLKFYPEPVA